MHGFDAAFGGARRDEEKVARQGAHLLASARRATLGSAQPAAGTLEPVQHAASRPGEIDPRVSAVELDRARRLGIHPAENIPVVPLYFAKSGRWSSAAAR